MVSAYLEKFDMNRVKFWLLALTLLLLPIGLGGQRPLPFGLAQLGIGFFFAFYALSASDAVKLPQRLKVAGALFAAVLVWAWIQTLTIMPAAWQHPIWLQAQETLGTTTGAISLAPAAGMLVIERLITYALMLLGVFLLARDEKIAKRLVTMFWFTGVAICLYGIVVKAMGNTHVLWLPKWTYEKDITATFVSRNHFADYAGLVFITGFGLAWQSLRGMWRTVKPHQRIAELQSWLLKAGLPYLVALSLVMLTIVLSHSRAGLLSTVVGMAAFTCAFFIYQRRVVWAIIVPGLVAIAAGAALSAFGALGRFATLFTDASSNSRATIYTLVQDAITANPWFGHGLGSFEWAFRLYRDTQVGEFFNRAHSDWLEAAFDLGVPMALVLFTAIALIVSGCWHGVRTRRQHGLYPALGLGASALVLSHAMVDFNMQISGVVASWILLLGVGLAQGWSSREKD